MFFGAGVSNHTPGTSTISDTHWHSYKHYLLFFHDEIFEVVAKSHQIEVFYDSVFEVYREAARRLSS